MPACVISSPVGCPVVSSCGTSCATRPDAPFCPALPYAEAASRPLHGHPSSRQFFSMGWSDTRFRWQGWAGHHRSQAGRHSGRPTALTVLGANNSLSPNSHSNSWNWRCWLPSKSRSSPSYPITGLPECNQPSGSRPSGRGVFAEWVLSVATPSGWLENRQSALALRLPVHRV